MQTLIRLLLKCSYTLCCSILIFQMYSCNKIPNCSIFSAVIVINMSRYFGWTCKGIMIPTTWSWSNISTTMVGGWSAISCINPYIVTSCMINISSHVGLRVSSITWVQTDWSPNAILANGSESPDASEPIKLLAWYIWARNWKLCFSVNKWQIA